MKKLELGLGMALGLFAIFGILRYRTDTIRTKEMTYLFIVIGLAVINSLSNRNTSYAELIVINLTIFTVAMLKEAMIGRANGVLKSVKKDKNRNKQRKFAVDYDRLELLGPDSEAQLIEDLRERIGIDVQRVEVQNIDLRNRCAALTVWVSKSEDTKDDELAWEERPGG